MCFVLTAICQHLIRLHYSADTLLCLAFTANGSCQSIHEGSTDLESRNLLLHSHDKLPLQGEGERSLYTMSCFHRYEHIIRATSRPNSFHFLTCHRSPSEPEQQTTDRTADKSRARTLEWPAYSSMRQRYIEIGNVFAS